MAQAEGQGRLVLPPAPTRSSARSTPGDGRAGGARGGGSLPAKSAAHGSGVGVAPYRDGGGGAGGGVAPTEMGEFLRLVTVAVRNGAIDMEHARVSGWSLTQVGRVPMYCSYCTCCTCFCIYVLQLLHLYLLHLLYLLYRGGVMPQ